VAPVAYRDGECLVEEGGDTKELFVLLDGALVVEREGAAPGAPPAVLACISSEDGLAIVGEMAHLGSLRRTATVRSSGYSRLLRLEPAQLDAIVEGCPELTRVICRQFSLRLQETLAALTRLQARFAVTPTRRMAQDGEVLFRRGEAASELVQLLAGSLRLEGEAGSRTVTPETAPGGFVDLEPFLRGGPHAETATVDGMAFLALVAPSDREALVRCFPELVLGILARS
jgi:CRP-like cAMP-binding protein